MKIILNVLFILLFSIDLHSQTKPSLTIEVTNIATIQGSIKACLVNKEADFLSKCLYAEMVKVGDNSTLIHFNQIEPGNYSVSLYHDKDNNGKLNTGGWFNLPKEPYGFSNNPSTFFGPPKFDKCLIEVKQDRKIVIKL